MTARLTIHDDLLPIGVTAEDIAPAITVEEDHEVQYEQRMKVVLLLSEIDNCLDGLIMMSQGIPAHVTIDEIKTISTRIKEYMLPEFEALRDTLQPKLF